jgi:hypothetical protein
MRSVVGKAQGTRSSHRIIACRCIVTMYIGETSVGANDFIGTETGLEKISKTYYRIDHGRAPARGLAGA